MELNKYRLDDLERRFATELSYGAAKAGGVLDILLEKFSARPLIKLPPMILCILRLAVYQIFYLDRVPDSAACNEAVKQARKFGHEGTAKYVNAVLRSAVRWKESGGLQQDSALAKKVLLQHPDWLVKRWENTLGEEETRQLCLLNNQPPALCLRVNTLKTDRAELAALLQKEGAAVRASVWSAEGLVSESMPPLLSLTSFKEGLYQVQDESSMLVAHFLDVTSGQTVIDLCAAPGGKTTHIAELMENKGKIFASDIYEHKLKIISDNAKRLGITIIDTILADATEEKAAWLDKADRVLVDAPCSGLGVLRRRPDLRWRRNEKDLAVFPPLQSLMLANAAKYLRKGGKLVYSTCTTEEAENMFVVKEFLLKNSDFGLEKMQHPLTGAMVDYLQLWPQRDGVDGFFICRLKRET